MPLAWVEVVGALVILVLLGVKSMIACFFLLVVLQRSMVSTLTSQSAFLTTVFFGVGWT